MFVPPTETTLFFSANLKSSPSCTPAPTVIAILLPFHVELVVHDEAWNSSWKTVSFKLCVQILGFLCQQAVTDLFSFERGCSRDASKTRASVTNVSMCVLEC